MKPLLLPLLALLVFGSTADAQVPIENRPPESRTASVVPNPDPTERTIEALLRAVGDLKEDIAALKELQDARFEGMAEAVKLLQDQADKEPTSGIVMERLIALESMLDERDKRTTTQFAGIETRAAEKAKSDEANIGAALAAQKELGATNIATAALAAEKNEKNFTEQLGQLRDLAASETKGLKDQLTGLQGAIGDRALGAEVNAKIEGLQATVSEMQNQISASRGQGAGREQFWGWIVAGAGVAFGVFAMSRRAPDHPRPGYVEAPRAAV